MSKSIRTEEAMGAGVALHPVQIEYAVASTLLSIASEGYDNGEVSYGAMCRALERESAAQKSLNEWGLGLAVRACKRPKYAAFKLIAKLQGRELTMAQAGEVSRLLMRVDFKDLEQAAGLPT